MDSNMFRRFRNFQFVHQIWTPWTITRYQNTLKIKQEPEACLNILFAHIPTFVKSKLFKTVNSVERGI